MYTTIEGRIMLLMFFVVCILALTKCVLRECPRTGINKKKVFFANGLLFTLVFCLTLKFVPLSSLGGAAPFEKMLATAGWYALVVPSLLFAILSFLNVGARDLHDRMAAQQRRNADK